MDPTKKAARIAGLLYLLLVVFGPLRLIYIPNTLFVSGDAVATTKNIAAHEWLFRLGIVSDLCCAVVLILLVLALYRLFKGVDQNQAVLVVILGGVMPATLYFVNVVNDFAALLLVRGKEFLAVIAKPQRDALAMLFLRLHDQQCVAAEILWGAWLFPLAIVVYRSRFLPRLLAVWLVIAGLAYLAMSFTGVLFPHYEDAVFDMTRPARLGEVAFMLWLVIMGAKAQPSVTPGSSSSGMEGHVERGA